MKNYVFASAWHREPSCKREREKERVVGTLQSMKVKSILVISLHNGRQINKLLVR